MMWASGGLACPNQQGPGQEIYRKSPLWRRGKLEFLNGKVAQGKLIIQALNPKP